MTKTELINAYLRSIGRTRVQGQSLEPLLPFLLGDAIYTIYNQDIAPLEKYGHEAPYKAGIGNYNWHLHRLMKDIGLDDPVRIEERRNGVLVVETVPKWKMISSHTARRTAITINVLRGHNIHGIKKCSGHTDLRVFDNYVRDE